MIISRTALRPANIRLESAACLLCQWRSFNISHRKFADKPAVPSESNPKTPAPPPSPLEGAPRAYGKAVSEFTPKPLGRPIGLPNPPRAGENSGIDNRTWKQRRDDFVNYDKHLVKRKELTHKISKPYFREWSNMRLHKGKSFLAPPGLFKKERALYFPNLQGQTLIKGTEPMDTTPTLEDKISVVSVFSSTWAENQAATFVEKKENPALHEVIRSSGGFGQVVRINVEEDAMKAWLIKFFMGGLRKRIGKENWGKYFLVRRGLTDDMRDSIGLLNSKVGYTYVLDEECRIRWAGSGRSEGDEKEGLVKGVRRLIVDLKAKRKTSPPSAEEQVGAPGNVAGNQTVAAPAA